MLQRVRVLPPPGLRPGLGGGGHGDGRPPGGRRGRVKLRGPHRQGSPREGAPPSPASGLPHLVLRTHAVRRQVSQRSGRVKPARRRALPLQRRRSLAVAAAVPVAAAEAGREGRHAAPQGPRGRLVAGLPGPVGGCALPDGVLHVDPQPGGAVGRRHVKHRGPGGVHVLLPRRLPPVPPTPPHGDARISRRLLGLAVWRPPCVFGDVGQHRTVRRLRAGEAPHLREVQHELVSVLIKEGPGR